MSPAETAAGGVTEAEVESGARALCIARGVNPDCQHQTYPGNTLFASPDGHWPERKGEFGRPPTPWVWGWRLKAQQVRAVLDAAATVREPVLAAQRQAHAEEMARLRADHVQALSVILLVGLGAGDKLTAAEADAAGVRAENERIRANMDLRDRFIAARGLWPDFVASLPSHNELVAALRPAGEAGAGPSLPLSEPPNAVSDKSASETPFQPWKSEGSAARSDVILTNAGTQPGARAAAGEAEHG